MKSIHPKWYNDAKISCVCGNSFTAGSTLPQIRVEVCGVCHPFYTGRQKLLDVRGQVERFTKMTDTAVAKKAQIAKIMESRASKVQKDKTVKPSLKDLLVQARKSSAS